MDSAPEKRGTPDDSLPSARGVLSIVLAVVGPVIFFAGVENGRGSGDYGHSALVGFMAWLAFAVVGAVLAVSSLYRYKVTITASVGLFLCAIPFLLVLYVLSINAHN